MEKDNTWLIGGIIVVVVLFFGGFGMMGFGMMSGFYLGMGLFGWVIQILIIVVLVLLIILLVKKLQGGAR